LNHRPPGPEISVQNPHIVDLVSLRGYTASSRFRILHPMLHQKLLIQTKFKATPACRLQPEAFLPKVRGIKGCYWGNAATEDGGR
jgi:hypothetical protein